MMATSAPARPAAGGSSHIEAVFSECGSFRHTLVETWDPTLPMAVWVLMNPSIAGGKGADGQTRSDPTARKGKGFSQRLGFGSQVFVNLFDFISTKPAGLKRAGYPVSPDCDRYILQACSKGKGGVICAWGANARGLARPHEVLRLIRAAGFETYALGFTEDGIPRHPLMLAYSTPLEPFS